MTISVPSRLAPPSARLGHASHQELERRGGRELGCASEPAEVRVELGGQVALGLVDAPPARGSSVGCAHPRRALEPLDGARRRRADLVAAGAPCLGDALEHLAEARHPVAGLRREVGPAVERHAVGVDEDVQRPAAVAGHRLHRPHVDGVDVRPLLAVHLHRDEVLVHERGGLSVLERLVLHHVAPVAGRVADRHQQRLVLAPARGRAPPRPTDASPRGCPCAGGGRGWSGRRAGSPSRRYLPIRSEANASNAAR